MSTQRYSVHHQSILDWAKEYKGPKFSAILCDPPYHLTSIADRFGKADSAPAKYGKDGAFQRASSGFMNARWDGVDENGIGIAFNPETWRAIKEHLYPGAFGMAFASSRGFHRMATAIEDAGFIIHPAIFCWAFGSGFPKASRIDSVIDRRAGAQPKIIGKKKQSGAKFKQTQALIDNGGFNDPERNEFDLTEPTTELARAWKGHRYGGQMLKPAVEPIILFSKPKETCYDNLEEQINVTNVLLGDLWNIFAQDAEIITRVAWRVNTVLLNALQNQTYNFKGSGLNAEIAERLSTKPLVSLNQIAASEEGIVLDHAIPSTDQNLPTDSASSAASRLKPPTRFGLPSIAVENAQIPPDNSPCWKTPYEMGIDTAILADILQYNLVREKFDLNMIWLWRLILIDLCDVANKSTTATAEKMTIELGILNYLLRKLMQNKNYIQSEKNLSEELSSVVQDATKAFIGLSTYQREREHSGSNAIEPIIVFQKPYDGDAVSSILATGAGALNIDGSRIAHNEDIRVLKAQETGHSFYKQAGRYKDVSELKPEGRWPANLVLEHAPECKPVGNKRVKSANGKADLTKTGDPGVTRIITNVKSGAHYGDVTGHETVTEWQCIEGCPVRMLDEQSGGSRSAYVNIENAKRNAGKPTKPGVFGGNVSGLSYTDTGTASRFFFNADWQLDALERADPIAYVPKASTAERDAGLHQFPPLMVNDGRETPIDNAYQRGETPRFNPHATVKPLSLTKYLATLLLPPEMYAPNRRLFVPFSGVNSEVIGALLAGWDEVVGVELEKKHVEYAIPRTDWWVEASRVAMTTDPKQILSQVDEATPLEEIKNTFTLFDLLEAV